MALSNHPAPDWSRRTVLFPAVTGTIFQVALAVVAIDQLNVCPVTGLTRFPLASLVHPLACS